MRQDHYLFQKSMPNISNFVVLNRERPLLILSTAGFDDQYRPEWLGCVVAIDS